MAPPRRSQPNSGAGAIARARADRARSRGPRRLHVDERRGQLLELGLTLFANTTYDELSIDAIAEAAGISKGLLYHYFSSKRDFYVETVRLAVARLLEAARAATDDRISPALLERGLDTFLDFAERHGRPFVSLLRGGLGADPEVAAIIDGTRDALLQRALDRLSLADNRRAQVALRGWIGFCEVTSLDWLEHGRDLDRGELRDLMAQMLVAALVAAGIDPLALLEIAAGDEAG
ncbi:MAG: helix-turn-helix domain-containing protein [Nannocystaceae bacterium]